MALDQQRGPFAGGAGVVGIARRIEQAERGLPVGGREFHALHFGQVVGEVQLGAIENVGRLLQHRVPAGAEIEGDDAGGVVGRAGAKHNAGALRPHRAEFGERGIERAECSVGEVQHGQAPEPRLRIGADDPPWAGKGIARHPENPLRRAELRRHRRQRARGSRRQVEVVEIPPARAVGHEREPRAVGRPFRLEDGFGCASGDYAWLSWHALSADVGKIEQRAVPRHVGVIPRQPGELVSVGRKSRRGVEIVPARKHAPGLAAAVEIDGDDGIDRLAAERVILAHADPAIAAVIDHAVGEPPLPVARGRLRRQRLRRGPVRRLAIEATVGEIGEIDRPVAHGPRSAAIFVHAGADVVGLRRRCRSAARPPRRAPRRSGPAPAGVLRASRSARRRAAPPTTKSIARR